MNNDIKNKYSQQAQAVINFLQNKYLIENNKFTKIYYNKINKYDIFYYIDRVYNKNFEYIETKLFIYVIDDELPNKVYKIFSKAIPTKDKELENFLNTVELLINLQLRNLTL
jgi:hypothetical protein